MGEEKEKIQQPDIGQGKDKFETIGTILSVVALSIFFGFILMAIATTVENSAKSILSIISSIMFTIAAIVIIIDTIIKHILHQKSVKKIVLSVFAMLFTALCTGILIVSGINTVYKKEILNDIIYWLVAAVMIVVSIAVITLQFLINKNDFEQNPIKSYAVIILTMLYALTYAMIVKPDIVFNIAFTIHTMASLVVFINIIFKTGIKSKNIIQLALFVIAVLALMAQMIYSIYIWFFNAEYPDLFNAIMGVFAGLLGGVLTLTGVAWTIKKQDEIRKEEEKKKMKPYIILHPTLFGEVIQLNNYDLNVDEKIETNKYKIDYFETKFNLFSVSITDNADLIWCGAIIGQSYIEFGEIKFGKRGSTFTIDLNPYFNDLRSNFEIDKVSIVYKDLSENYYKCLMYGSRRIKYLKDHVHCDMAIERVELPQEVNKIELETMLYRR